MSNTFSRVSSSSVSKDGKRTIKVEEIGVKTALEVSSFGDDSVPLKGMSAVYGKTSENSEAVILGYVNENQEAKEGEKRLYSLNSDGSIAFYIWLKNDGTCELGGTTYTAVRYEPLNTAIATMQNQINAELTKIATAISSIVPGAYVPSTISSSISSAQSEKVKIL